MQQNVTEQLASKELIRKVEEMLEGSLDISDAQSETLLMAFGMLPEFKSEPSLISLDQAKALQKEAGNTADKVLRVIGGFAITGGATENEPFDFGAIRITMFGKNNPIMGEVFETNVSFESTGMMDNQNGSGGSEKMYGIYAVRLEAFKTKFAADLAAAIQKADPKLNGWA